jgi:LacI family transcriptional regulator
VDVSTVSRVLNADASVRVAEATRERILQAARRLGYRANELARALRTARSRTLGMVVPQLDNPVFALAIAGAEKAAWSRGHSLLIAHEHDLPPGQSVYDNLVHANRVDGLIVASLAPEEALLHSLHGCGVPFVLINRRTQAPCSSVTLDGREAAAMAVRHLVALGHRRIAHLAGRPQGFNGPQRQRGFLEALQQAGIEPDPALIIPVDYTVQGGATGMRQLLHPRGEPPTAVVVATTVAAAGALAVLHEQGLRVPQDMSVVGIHDLPLAEVLHPPLTTVRLPTQAMGHEAALGLIDTLETGRPGPDLMLPPMELVVRQSTAAPLHPPQSSPAQGRARSRGRPTLTKASSTSSRS